MDLNTFFGGDGEFPADYESMMVMGKSYAYDDDDLDYLHNSAISFSQLFQSDSPGSQSQWQGQKEQEMSSPEMEEDWLTNLPTSEDSFDPEFLESIDLDSLDQKNVHDEVETDIIEDVHLSASQVSEVQEDSCLAELLADGPGVGISPEFLLGSQEEVEDGDWLRNLLSSELSFDPNFLENIAVDSQWNVSEDMEESERTESTKTDEDLGYTVEMEIVEVSGHNLRELSGIYPPTPPQSPEERSGATAGGEASVLQPPGIIAVSQTKLHSRSLLKSVCQPAGAVEVIVERDSGSTVEASVTSHVKKKKGGRMLEEERAAHNLLERQRRKELNTAYDHLRDSIPAIAANKKSSKQNILDAALNYCQGLAGKVERLERIQQEEVERRRVLEERLSRLQAEN